MAAFRIHEDYEKENPKPAAHMIKEKSVLASHGAGSTLLGGAKDKLQQLPAATRPNFAVLNANTNATNGGWNKIINMAATGANKATNFLTQNNNAKQNDENAGYATHAVKKASVPVEQFKTFSVYEDQPSDQQLKASSAASATTISQTVSSNSSSTTIPVAVDKENVCLAAVQQKRDHHAGPLVAIKSDILQPDDEDYVLDTTPMSVSEVLSPMSVDTSLVGAAHHKDEQSAGLSVTEAVKQKEQQQAAPNKELEAYFDVPEYQNDILDYFRESEKKHRPKPNYMRRQSDINYSMRTILVDWLVEVSEEYHLNTETLYLSVSYIDRFLSQMSVVRSKLQLVGTAAMFISSKYEEIYPPDVSEFVFITDDTYTKAQVLRMEQIILKILAFDLCTPTPYAYLNAYAIVLKDVPDELLFLAQYISELSLLEGDPYLRFLPSVISSAAMALARCTLQMPIWSSDLEAVTTYRVEDLQEVFLCLTKTHVAAEKLAQQAIQEKYKSAKFKHVSQVKALELDEQRFRELALEYNASKAAQRTASGGGDNVMMQTTANQENVRRMISRMFQ